MRRRAARRDANEADIIRALEARGWSVERLDGDGVPDLLVGRAGVNVLIEVKLPPGPRGGTKGRTLTPAQVQWHQSWRGQAAVVTSIEEALAVVAEAERGPCGQETQKEAQG